MRDVSLAGQVDEPVDVAAAAGELMRDLMFRPWGQVSPSVYETGRLVTLAPWLLGHDERVAYLVATQRPDGSWGVPDGYGLVPTLSATEALLSVLTRGDHGVDRDVLIGAVRRGLRVLSGWLAETAVAALPDTPAIEIIVPALVSLINAHLDGLSECEIGRLPIPEGMSEGPLTLIRQRLESGAALPDKLLHALEVAGRSAASAPAVNPTSIGTVGASPAATAAWLSGCALPDPGHHARRYLEAVALRHGGPVPVGLPITVFERGWVLSWLARAGIRFDVPPEMLADLRAAIGPGGTPAGAGLPPDADTTSVALYALALLGVPYEPDSLWAFETPTHFCTWQGEEGSSVSVNAHVLDAFGQFAAARPEQAPRYVMVLARLAAWLRERQRADGSWDDRWHASPYYATVSCALALHEFGGPESVTAVRSAVRWVLATQREDGSWGRWGGTAEETAYAVQLLLMTGPLTGDGGRAEAVRRAYRYLLRSADPADGPALWHDKDLYLPLAVVRAAVLAALHLAQSSGLVVQQAGQL
ncbi:prenyltransferase/squalene oxidase repeat-containing protein [Microbispora sp. H10830]|uniref:prenyltransferase/squalene oxidase repeat-containing protein n=1 Tax=Microbispora sp. H10830 TaxID=2729109 RepID=UPI00287367F4|nr:prenyltransferase/squalene oxidase repeat-containing protein [Microbispora sp. H10830]